MAEPDNPWTRQSGGSHYQAYAIQPSEYIYRNRLPWLEANIIKYVSRFRDKNGMADLDKAQHYLDLLKFEYAKEVAGNG